MNDISHFTDHAGGRKELVSLDREHPGFRDSAYRSRRDDIARIALAHQTGAPVPVVDYIPEEHAIWQKVWLELQQLR